MRPEFHLIEVKLDATPGPDSEGASSRYPELCVDHTVQVSGVFVADLRLEVSNDGATWTELDAFTAPEIAVYEGTAFRFARVRTNAYTSGTPVVRYGGMNHRVEA